jgi:ATP-dependent Clp protease ATP-binding subunit ClpC
MFERFGRDVRYAVTTAANEFAGAAGEDKIRPDHLLLALAADRDSLAAQALDRVGLDREGVEEALAADTGALLAGVGVVTDAIAASAPLPGPPSKPRFAPASKRVLEQALREALDRGDRHIGSHHLLLGLVRVDSGGVPRVLARAGVSVDQIETAVEEIAPRGS